MKNIYILFVYILFFLLPLVNTKLGDMVFIPTSLFVDGNFEFTKVMFFNVMMGCVLGFFLIESIWKKKKILLPKSMFFILVFLFLIIISSTLLSLSPYVSTFGNMDKSHSLLVFTNLLGLSIVIYNTKKKYLENILRISVLSLLCVCLISIKEYVFPTFNYGNLSDRAIGTFGHPNYLALFILMLLPFVVQNKKYTPILAIAVATLILTKSLLGIVIGGMVLGYYMLKKMKILLNSSAFFGTIFVVIGIVCVLGYMLVPIEKFHSFLSRFYLWETTLRIIFSDWKVLVFGGGAETLDIYFNSFKSPYLYIYENFGFTADRPHNFLLNIWYHFGILGFGVLIYILYMFQKHLSKKNLGSYEMSICVFLIFCMFNYPSVAIYTLLILSIVQLVKKYSPGEMHSFSPPIFLAVCTCVSIYGSISSVSMYRAELYSYDKKYDLARDTFPHAKYYYALGDTQTGKLFDSLPSDKYYKSNIRYFRDIAGNCDTMTLRFPSVENWFYCGKILEKLNKPELAKQYYEMGLLKLPDLWNSDSVYWENTFIKKTITGNRFFSEKFGDIESILEKVGK